MAQKNLNVFPTEPAPYGDRKRVAFVTGAAQGIGRSIALRLAKDGFDVAINDLGAELLSSTGEELKKLGAKVSLHVGDVSDEKRVEAMIAECISELGFLDVMVSLNNPLLISHTIRKTKLFHPAGRQRRHCDL